MYKCNKSCCHFRRVWSCYAYSRHTTAEFVPPSLFLLLLLLVLPDSTTHVLMWSPANVGLVIKSCHWCWRIVAVGLTMSFLMSLLDRMEAKRRREKNGTHILILRFFYSIVLVSQHFTFDVTQDTASQGKCKFPSSVMELLFYVVLDGMVHGGELNCQYFLSNLFTPNTNE